MPILVACAPHVVLAFHLPPQHVPHCLQSCTCDIGYVLVLDAATNSATCELLSPPSHQLSTLLAAIVPPVTLLLLGLAVLLHRSKGKLSTYATYFVRSTKPPGMRIAASLMACLLGITHSSGEDRHLPSLLPCAATTLTTKPGTPMQALARMPRWSPQMWRAALRCGSGIMS